MRLSAEAWRLREEARAAIVSGDWAAAMRHADESQRIQATISGDALLKLCRALIQPETTS
jgi:hypothetical protein